MATEKRLMPEPGVYAMPVMDVLRVTSTDDPGFIQIVFGATAQRAGQTEAMTIRVPVRTIQAAGLLRSLRMLEARGLIPAIVEPDQGGKPS